MKIQVCAATVAYNNPKELARLLLSLTNQGPELQGLIIIDNSDYRCAAKNKKIFDAHFEQYQFAQYYKTKANTGSAGGFSHAMKIAHENGFDCVWLLDQDGVAADLCLAELLKNFDKGDILCPKVVDIDRPAEILTYLRSKKNFFGRLYPVPLSALNFPIDAFGTHGTLILKKVMDFIGYYDSCNFFVGLEDYDYAHRARHAKFVITLVGAAEARHPHLWPLDVKKHRPAHLGFITTASHIENCQKQDRSLATFSNFYLLTKSLTHWQFAVTFVYSLCDVLLIKFVKRNEICLKLTVNAYVKCFASNLRRDWPYGCLNDFCQQILK